MSYAIRLHDDPPVVWVTMGEDFCKEDFEPHVADVFELLNGLDTPLYQIIDIRAIKVGFDDVMEFLRLGARGDRALTTHPKNRGNLIITDSRFYALVAQGLRTASFGNVNVQTYTTPEAALEWLRKASA